MDSVILVRHGQSTLNVQRIISSDNLGYPLTATGRQQIRELAEQIPPERINGIISSPVQRAVESAGIISRTLSLDMTTDERIRESGMGALNNFRISGIPRKRHRELGMESWESHIDRFSSLVSSMEGRYILVSHAYPIRAFLCSYLGLGEYESAGIEVGNATASVIDLGKGRVLSIGSHFLSEPVREFIRS